MSKIFQLARMILHEILLLSKQSQSLVLYILFFWEDSEIVHYVHGLIGSFIFSCNGKYQFPALNCLSRDLNVSNTLIDLTLTSYLVDRSVFHICGSSR